MGRDNECRGVTGEKNCINVRCMDGEFLKRRVLEVQMQLPKFSYSIPHIPHV